MKFIKSLWYGTTSDVGDDDDKKPPAAGGLLARNPPPPTPAETEEKLKRAMGTINKNIGRLERQIKQREEQLRVLMGQGRKAEARRMVPKAKADERALAQERDKLENLRSQLGMTQSVESAVAVADAYKASAATSRAQLGQFDREEIERIMEDTRYVKQDMEEINEMLGEPMGASGEQAQLDELEAEDYLAELMGEPQPTYGVQPMPSVPVATPEPPVQPARRIQFDDV
jgi:hypothetical protein